MSGWAWFAMIWFGTLGLMFSFSLATTVARGRWGLSTFVLDQIEHSVAVGIERWMNGDGDDDKGGPGRPDVLPLEFDDVDGLSEQL